MPEKLSYQLIDRNSDHGRVLHEILSDLVNHREVSDAKFLLAWDLNWQACWKRELEAFAAAFAKPSGAWPSGVAFWE